MDLLQGSDALSVDFRSGFNMNVPAHKVVGDVGKPGQLVNDQTLGDYLARKRRYDALDTVALEKINAIKKLTFEDAVLPVVHKFFNDHDKRTTLKDYNDVLFWQAIWKAAQENV
jgi:hypothetical protein